MVEVRRKDYQSTDGEAIRRFLDEMSHGHLAFNRKDGAPGLVALNFARAGETIYFHGAPEGEKVRALAADPRATLMVTADFALIPSYFRDPEMACPATQYYRAVVVRGDIRFVESREEKARGLQALMEKLQPEGGHRPIRGDDPFYAKSLDTTCVLALPMTDVTAKFKFGQNLPRRGRRDVAERLAARGAPGDDATVAAIRDVCPF
jgi:nitroimidazol reductase NimA-like FMN-containing flavoprotein (pyridoxamine 5'-phosphate oxidase superfamily)